jgi:hypothetical protein
MMNLDLENNIIKRIELLSKFNKIIIYRKWARIIKMLKLWKKNLKI